MHDDDFAAALDVLAGRQLLAQVASPLRAEGIAVVALKGVVLSALAERLATPRARPMLDLDVLIPAERRRDAEQVLDGLGFRVLARTRVAVTMRHRNHALDLDLHVGLCEPELFRLDTPSMIARAIPARDLLGVDALRLAPIDAYAHLVAHFVRSRANAHDARHVADFALVGAAEPVEAALQAAHLDALGLGRAARYALGLAAKSDHHARAVRAALEPDTRGDLAAALARRWLARSAGRSLTSIPALHLLNAHGRGMRSLALHAGHGLAALARRMRERG